ncbi:hypothetical protein DY000_02023300 [Brassica cretica]|uniref:Uncharacterized protein n=1 Tax=Brassica cretica TaxID=69181 RepID=A0ABQ7E369_BRACR|nr:hypothetical protein DY000_02023300 [Brassica cretica]
MENRLCFDPGTTPTPLSKEHCKKLCIISSVSDLFDKVSSNDIKRSGLDHLENSFELDLQQLVLCSRKSFDSFVFKENSFSLSSYGHELIIGILHVLKMSYDISCPESILIYNTFFDKNADPWISNSRNCAITCPDTILVYTYFDRLHDDLKRVLHVLEKETLVSNLNKYLSCTYDPEDEVDGEEEKSPSFCCFVGDKDEEQEASRIDFILNCFKMDKLDFPQRLYSVGQEPFTNKSIAYYSDDSKLFPSLKEALEADE